MAAEDREVASGGRGLERGESPARMLKRNGPGSAPPVSAQPPWMARVLDRRCGGPSSAWNGMSPGFPSHPSRTLEGPIDARSMFRDEEGCLRMTCSRTSAQATAASALPRSSALVATASAARAARSEIAGRSSSPVRYAVSRDSRYGTASPFGAESRSRGKQVPSRGEHGAASPAWSAGKRRPNRTGTV